jgi:hypothetical protein
MRIAAFCLVFLVTAATCRMAHAQDVAEIIRKSIEANDRDWAANPQFDYFETDRNANGTRTYQVTMLLGTPYERLLKVNGKDLTPAQKAQQQRKYEQVLAQRKAESSEQRSRRIQKFEADRRRDHVMLQQLTKAFNFTIQGEQQLAGRAVYVLNATPRPGYRPPNRDSQVLPGMEGTLWIDKETSQWVKVEAHVIRPVMIEGFLAKVEPGTKFELEKTPVEGNIWLPTHYAMTGDAKVFDLISHHSQEEETYFNYHKRQSSESTSSPEASRRVDPGKDGLRR